MRRGWRGEAGRVPRLLEEKSGLGLAADLSPHLLSLDRQLDLLRGTVREHGVLIADEKVAREKLEADHHDMEEAISDRLEERFLRLLTKKATINYVEERVTMIYDLVSELDSNFGKQVQVLQKEKASIGFVEEQILAQRTELAKTADRSYVDVELAMLSAQVTAMNGIQDGQVSSLRSSLDGCTGQLQAMEAKTDWLKTTADGCTDQLQATQDWQVGMEAKTDWLKTNLDAIGRHCGLSGGCYGIPWGG